MTIQGVPAQASAEVETFLAPVRRARYDRTRRMVERTNALLGDLGLQAIDFENDVVAHSKFPKAAPSPSATFSPRYPAQFSQP